MSLGVEQFFSLVFIWRTKHITFLRFGFSVILGLELVSGSLIIQYSRSQRDHTKRFYVRFAKLIKVN